jgi:signal transduction histidine kinase
VPVRDSQYASRLLDSIRSGLVAIDSAGCIAALNATGHRLLECDGDDPEAALGRPCREVLARHPAVAQRLAETLDGVERPSRCELSLGRGEPTIGYTVSAIRGASGTVAGAVLLFRDLTPFERNAEQQRLRERLAALGEMAAGLAHEIRNPLAGMEILTGLLRRRLAEQPEELALVNELSSEIRRVAQTVTDSLEFVRPVALRSEPVDPVEVLEESLARARSRVPFEVDVRRDYAETLPPLRADGERLEGVLTNLIVNSFEAMHGAGSAPARVSLGLRVYAGEPFPGAASVEREIVFSVGDTGPGIPDELRERIFYPFFTTKQRGSGIGLAQAQKIVAGHGGRLELESECGRGATFRIRLPIDGEPCEGPARLRLATAETRGRASDGAGSSGIDGKLGEGPSRLRLATAETGGPASDGAGSSGGEP